MSQSQVDTMLWLLLQSTKLTALVDSYKDFDNLKFMSHYATLRLLDKSGTSRLLRT